jgi:hypothetical protein
MLGSDGSESGGEANGVVYFCLGQPQTFSCEVPKLGFFNSLRMED